jgi:hypothetical protein
MSLRLLFLLLLFIPASFACGETPDDTGGECFGGTSVQVRNESGEPLTVLVTDGRIPDADAGSRLVGVGQLQTIGASQGFGVRIRSPEDFVQKVVVRGYSTSTVYYDGPVVVPPFERTVQDTGKSYCTMDDYVLHVTAL